MSLTNNPNNKVLLLGATGGCGSQVLVRLLKRGIPVTVIVRSEIRLPEAAKGHPCLTVVTAPNGHLDLGDDELDDHLRGCDCAISCLGHNLTFKGIFCPPRDLCVRTVRRLFDAARRVIPDPASTSPRLRLIVVSTEGVSRFDGADPRRGVLERLLIGALYFALPPMKDNVEVVRYLHGEMKSRLGDEGSDSPCVVEFCAVRPSDMRDGEESSYTTHETLQNGIFNAGVTTRANVGAFMADLVTSEETWKRWRNSFPHILDVTK